MRIIITGADGYIGRHLVSSLKGLNYELMLIGKDAKYLKASFPKSISYSYKELLQEELVDVFSFFQPSGIIHLAGYSTASDIYAEQVKLFNANILYLGQILDAVRNVNIDFFIYTGSSTEYLNSKESPDSAYLYSATKAAGRELIKYYSRAYNFKLVSILPYNVYGGVNSNRKILDILIDSLYSKERIPVTNGEQELDFIYIDDLVNLYIKVVDNIDIVSRDKMIFGGTGKTYTLRKISQILEKETSLNANLDWGALTYRKRDTMKSIADIEFQKNTLQWKPMVSLPEGLKYMIKERTN